MMNDLRQRVLVSMAVVGLLSALAGCGGGGGSATPANTADNSVPDAAAQSPTAFIEYLRKLTSDESSEPAAIKAGFKAPTDDAAEPVAMSGG